jgi:uncharacterized membrane protein
MESILVATFKDRFNAQACLERLRELVALDDITLYGLAFIHKRSEGSLELLSHEGPDPRDWPAQGSVIGALVGALAGPVGMLVGIMAGGITGSLNQSKQEDALQQFLRNIRSQLPSDSYALVLDVEEINPLIIDSYMQPYEGVVSRTMLTTLDTQEGLEEWEALALDVDPAIKKIEKARRKRKLRSGPESSK